MWKHVQSELTKDYKQLLQRLLDLGYEIKAIIIDGKRGLYKTFKDYPVQMCHFHQQKGNTEIYNNVPKIKSW